MVARLWVTGEITAASGRRFENAVEMARGLSIEALIDSEGGLIASAARMADALLDFPGGAEAVVLRADSAALLVLAACRSATAAGDASALVHEPAATVHLPALRRGDAEHLASAMRRQEVDFARRLEARTGRPDSFWLYLAERETTLTAQDMLAYGLVSSISPYPASYYRRTPTPRRAS